MSEIHRNAGSVQLEQIRRICVALEVGAKQIALNAALSACEKSLQWSLAVEIFGQMPQCNLDRIVCSALWVSLQSNFCESIEHPFVNMSYFLAISLIYCDFID